MIATVGMEETEKTGEMAKTAEMLIKLYSIFLEQL